MKKTTENPVIRVTPRSKALLRTPSKQAGKPDKLNDANLALRKDPNARNEELDERALWETTLTDGWSILP
jgi:hypothetical protein